MNRIKELRVQNKLKQSELASRLKIATSTLSYWENGKFEPDNDALVSLSNIFDVSIEYLLGVSNVSSTDNSNIIYIKDSTGTREIANIPDETFSKLKKIIEIVIDK